MRPLSTSTPMANSSFSPSNSAEKSIPSASAHILFARPPPVSGALAHAKSAAARLPLSTEDT